MASGQMTALKGRTYDRTVLHEAMLAKIPCQSGRSTYESEPKFDQYLHLDDEPPCGAPRKIGDEKIAGT